MGRSQQHFLSSSSSSSLTRSFTRLGSLFLNRLGNSNLCWRTCQLVVMTTTLVSLYTFILVFISVTSMTRHQKNRPITWLRRDQLQMPPESHLIDLIDFDYVLQPKGLCHHRNGQREKDQSESQEIYFIIYVHSAPGNSQVKGVQCHHIIECLGVGSIRAGKWFLSEE